MNIDEIKKISLIEFLNQLGYQPTGRDSKGLWFYSPCRSERKPSFHINPRKGGAILGVAQEATSSRPTPPIAATKARNIKAYTPAG